MRCTTSREMAWRLPCIIRTTRFVGLRIPDNEICRHILEELGNPILSASLPGEMVEDYTDPEIMQQKFGNQVELVVDGGIGGMIPSTIVDCTTDEWTVLREGAGEFDQQL
ncbi:MAG: hypothetical protein EOO04_33690 [Chitinophagaceae bacterium]|nr:MAG: hypothetical protein EOO04_33690 [Chitinophagaceae bacterium]